MFKLWDIGGQPRFRSMWERYCRGVNAIVFMVDAADEDKLEASRYTIITLSAHCESALSLCAIPLTGSSLFYDKENCSIQVGSKLLNIIQKRADAAAGQAQS